MERLVIVGPGRIGLSLGQALIDADGVAGILYQGRHPHPPDHPIFADPRVEYRYGVDRPGEGTTALLLTVPDHVLEAMSELLSARGGPPPGTPALHCSGALGAEPLGALHRVGYRVGTLHPLQAVANPATGARRLLGASFAVSGEREALAASRRIVASLGGEALTVPTQQRPRYHAAAVLASNYVVVLLRAATRLLVSTGTSEDEAERAVIALARGTLENSAELGLDQALTGPVLRGDVDVVDLHMRSLPERERRLYVALGREVLDEVSDDLSPDVLGALNLLMERYS